MKKSVSKKNVNVEKRYTIDHEHTDFYVKDGYVYSFKRF